LVNHVRAVATLTVIAARFVALAFILRKTPRVMVNGAFSFLLATLR
jgi:hypothetical protein